LDGNVKRVFARVFGVEGYPGEKPVEDALWRRAVALLPHEGIESYTQGLMDLGATLCTRSSPDCQRCPLQARCVAFAQGRTAELPVRKPKKAVPEKQAAMLVVIDRGEVLLEQRIDSGIWGGLLSLPEVDGHGARGEVDAVSITACAARFGTVDEVRPLLPLVHVFTHYKLHILPYQVGLAARSDLDTRYQWWKLGDVARAPLPAPVKKLLLDLSAPSLF
jgi:A/G-specific adenine glycosylase